MTSLDVLDYATALDEALPRTMHARERRMAVREVREAMERMAFRYALIDGRAMPEDEDWARALEGLKAPAEAAPVLARRQPVYRKRRLRRKVTSWSVLVAFVAAAALFAQLATSETSTRLLAASGGTVEPTSEVFTYNFTVPQDATRLRFHAEVVVRNPDGVVTFTLVPQRGETVYVQPVTKENANYRAHVIEGVAPGNWTLFVDFHKAHAGFNAEIHSVAPTRGR